MEKNLISNRIRRVIFPILKMVGAILTMELETKRLSILGLLFEKRYQNQRTFIQIERSIALKIQTILKRR
jgi:hypothetical protein